VYGGLCCWGLWFIGYYAYDQGESARLKTADREVLEDAGLKGEQLEATLAEYGSADVRNDSPDPSVDIVLQKYDDRDSTPSPTEFTKGNSVTDQRSIHYGDKESV
jgi:hypothetical protein